MGVRVDIGIACSSGQSAEWWGPVFTRLLRETQRGIEIGQIIAHSSALPDGNKNETIFSRLETFDRELYEAKRRASLTDANRNKVMQGFLAGDSQGNKSDWIFWIDDDTVIPDGAITQLLKSGKPFVAGLYFLAREPFNPIAYIKDEETDWGYKSLYGFPMGSLFQVDSVGMGCTLIHRSVYERIMEEFAVYRRPNGTLAPVHASRIYNNNIPELGKQPPALKEMVVNGWLCQRIEQPDPDDNRSWPFYAMEYIRTEDHYFCELAAQVGIKPWIDSTVLCEHIKSHHVTYDHYKRHLETLLEAEEVRRD